MPKSGVYEIRNTTNGRVYVGSTRDLVRRQAYHLSRLRHKKHENTEMQRDFDEGHVFEKKILQLVADVNELLECEQRHIENNLPFLYNKWKNAKMVGFKHEPETIENIRNHPNVKHGKGGVKRHTDESKANLSERFSGEGSSSAKLTKEQVAAIREHLYKGVTVVKIASLYEVSRTTISDIKHGRTWA